METNKIGDEMTLQEMISAYEKRTGEAVDLAGFVDTGTDLVKDNIHFKVFPHSFLFWGITEREGVKYIDLLQTWGVMTEMAPYIRAVMEMNGLRHIATVTTRQPRAHMRKWKMKRRPDWDYTYEGRYYYALTGTIENLR